MVAAIGSNVKVVHAHDKSVISCDLKQKLVLNTLNASNISSHFILFYHHLRNSSFGRQKKQWNQLNDVEKCIEEKESTEILLQKTNISFSFHSTSVFSTLHQLDSYVHSCMAVRVRLHLCLCFRVSICVSVCLLEWLAIVYQYNNSAVAFSAVIITKNLIWINKISWFFLQKNI